MGNISEEEIESVRRATPMGRRGRASEVSNVVLFLLSDASSYISGTEIVVDGGLTSHFEPGGFGFPVAVENDPDI